MDPQNWNMSQKKLDLQIFVKPPDPPPPITPVCKILIPITSWCCYMCYQLNTHRISTAITRAQQDGSIQSLRFSTVPCPYCSNKYCLSIALNVNILHSYWISTTISECIYSHIYVSAKKQLSCWTNREPPGKQHFGIILFLQLLQSWIIGAKKDWRLIKERTSIASVNFRIYDRTAIIQTYQSLMLVWKTHRSYHTRLF